MTINTISTLPTAPARTDAPATFISRADAFLAALVVMQGELNTSIGQMNTDITQVNADAISAAASATAAANASNASVWVSGTTYALGDVVYSPVDYQSYRRIVAGAGTTDPSSDATNWTKISAEPLPTQTGNAGKFLTTDGSSASWADAAGGLSADFVASGTLSSGQTVILNSDGTVSAVTGQDTGAGSPAVFESATTTHISATFDSNSNKVVIVYTDGGNSNYGTAIVGTVSGASISFGSPVVFNSETSIYMSATFDSNSNKVVVAYRDHGNSFYGTAVVGTVSGTSISFGSPVVYESAAVEYNSATFDSNSNKIVISYRDDANSGYGTSVVGTVSGTSISFGSPVVFESASTVYTSATFDSSLNRIVIAYRDGGNSDYGTAVVGSVSGTSLSFGSPVVFESAESNDISATFDSNANKVVIAYRDNGNSNYGTAVVGTVSGISISFGSPVVYESASTTDISATFDSNGNKVVIVYTDGGNSGYGTAIIGTVSGTSISFDSPIVFESASSSSISATFDSNENAVIISYRDQGNSSYGTAVVFQNASTNSADFLGITSEAISDTATGEICLQGGLSETVSGLTIGEIYYVQNDGTLSTTVSDVTAGKALASNKLLLKGI